MPTVLNINGFRFYFYLNEHEPIHVHVSKGDSEARVVLVPELDISYSRGFKKNELRSIIEITITNYEKIIQAWNTTFDE
ncbi:DUF4160 domain-containing protein [Dyadobacter arcticus]|uniref:DUF4160 domain-containing protein n=1 Tax=Dyadobacter arcticus TaxID=1078754 RepID=A0ABX0UMR4_9BACT|nr:DUF4160 domain-containing protein [Dyadobacter arcticus]NIJ53399.1 hypothetical protein [Dyadobacter arcticus]